MFNVGGGEMIVIFILALVVLGPDKLPAAARQAGKYLSEFRRMSHGFQQELKDAIDIPELNDLKATLTTPLNMSGTTTPTPATTTTVSETNAAADASTPVEHPSNGTPGSEPSVARLDPPPAHVAALDGEKLPERSTTPSFVVEGPPGSFT